MTRPVKTITATRGVVQAFRGKIQFHRYKEGEKPTRTEKYPVLRTNTKPQQLIKRTKISYSIVSLVFHKFL